MSIALQRKCGGTRARRAWTYRTEELNEDLDYFEKSHMVGADSSRAGCGAVVKVVDLDATQPAEPGERPLFARSAPVVWCPTCDGTAELVADDVDQPVHDDL